MHGIVIKHGIVVIHGLAGGSQPRAVEAQFPWDTLPVDMQELIREHTATSFAVESPFTMRFRFPGVGWAGVPYLIRYEFKLMPRDLSAGPEIEVRVTRALDPAFRQSRLFAESDAPMQEMLVGHYRELRFLGISGAQVEMRHESGSPLPFVHFVSARNGAQRVLKTPCWSRLERSAIEEVREKLRAAFRMELGHEAGRERGARLASNGVYYDLL